MKKFIALLITTLTLGGFQTFVTAADADANVLSIKEVETAPVPVKQEAPILTADLQGIAAIVYVAFVIDEKGNVQNANVLKSTNDVLNAAAIDTVQKWVFKPAVNQGTSVPVRAVVPIRFTV